MSNHEGAEHCNKCGHVILADGIHIHNGTTACGDPR